MNLIETIRVGIDSLLANPLRSFLTVLGVVIGIASVIALISVGDSYRASVVNEFKGAGADVLRVTPGGRSFDRADVPQRLTHADGEALVNNPNAPAVSAVAAKLQVSGNASYNGRQVQAQVTGVTPNLLEVEPFKVVMGRFLSERDEAQLARVVVVPQALAQELFPGQDPLGKRLSISGYNFEIVGVIHSSSLTNSFFSEAYVPLSVAQQRLNASQLTRDLDVSELAVRARSEGEVAAAKEQVRQVLRERHGIAAGDEDDFSVFAESEFANSIERILTGITAFLALVGGISLLVGGIGIMNIMLVSVVQRTREIGLRRAVGARRCDIMLQFLIEAVALSLGGGLLGILVGWGSVSLIGNLMTIFARNTIIQGISPIAVIIATVFALLTGLIFGLYPARQAAQLLPIQALRYE
ncbi:MAG: ABC transporter permease [Chloroflexales bacterium]|nr:ABC transporter permease [Chloroflexales bacterium]